MAKLSLPSFVGEASATKLNTWKASLEAFAQDTVSRAGALPNSMSADLDMDSNDLLNTNVVYAQNLFLAGRDIERSLIWVGTTPPANTSYLWLDIS